MAKRRKPTKSKIEEWRAQEEAAGTDFQEAGKWAYMTCASYGLEFEFLERRAAFSVMRHLKLGKPPEQVAAEHGLKNWKRVWPSNAQVEFMQKLALPWRLARSKREAGLMLDAALNPLKAYKALVKAIDKAKTPGELNAAAKDVRLVIDILPEDQRAPLLLIGRRRRDEMGTDEFPEQPAESPPGATDGEA